MLHRWFGLGQPNGATMRAWVEADDRDVADVRPTRARSFEAFRDWVRSHPAAFLRLGSASDTPQNEEHAREVFGYWSKDDNELLVIRSAMRALLDEQNFSPSVVLPEWAAAGWLVREDAKNITVKRSVAGTKDRFFVVPTEHLDRTHDDAP